MSGRCGALMVAPAISAPGSWFSGRMKMSGQLNELRAMLA